MQNVPSTPIDALRDVNGVFGSFVVDNSGRLVMKDLPAVFDDSLFEEVGPRVVRLGETLSEGGALPETVSLRFAEHRLHVKFLRAGALATLCNLSVNPSALKMAITLTARRVEQNLETVRPGASATTTPLAGFSLPPDTLRGSLPPSLGSPSTYSTRAVAPESLTAPAPSSSSPDESKGRAPVMYRGRRIG
jgi:hypothetical protein